MNKTILALLLTFAVTAGAQDVQITTQPKTVAIIKDNGDIDVKMEPTKAAREFWKLVREDAQKCVCACPGDKK